MAKNWAICIGINRYRFLQPLRYARQDARAMQQFLQSEGRFNRVLLLADDAADERQRPDRANIRQAIRQLVREARMAAGDNFWFFFSGHGLRHEGCDYLMPLDGLRDEPQETAIPTSFVTDNLRECGADNVVLLLDACRNQDDKGGEGLGAQTAAEARQTGVISLFSCSPREYSYELEALKQGAFTWALLEGLGAQGQCATVARLDSFLQRRVPELVRQHRGEQERQTPYAIAEPIAKSNLILLPRYATPADLAAMKMEAMRAQLANKLGLAEQLWIRVNVAALGTDREALEAIVNIRLLQQGLGTSSPAPALTQPNAVKAAQSAPPQMPATPAKPALLTFSFKTARVDERGKIVEERDGQAEYFDEDLGDGVKLRMVAIPGGQFRMGSPKSEAQRDGDEGPQHEVRVSPFCLGEFPVTQAQWRAVAKQGAKVERDIEPEPSNFSGSDELPVEQVSWDDAVEFCARLSKLTGKDYRLPSEAEWEYACRAGTTTPFHFGPTITTDLANYDGNYTYASGPKGVYREKTTPRGTFKFANAFGLLDMHGNVWEWCADPWHENYQGAPDKTVIWSSSDESDNRRVLRGGSWNLNPWYCRSAFRFRLNRDFRSNSIGFRVACGAARTLPSSL